MAITFQRPLSSFIQTFFSSRAALNSRAYNTEIAVELTLGTGAILRYATKELTIDTESRNGSSVSISPLTFTARIEGAPEFRHSQGKPIDAGEFDIVNLDYLLSSAIPNNARPFDDTKVKVWICFPKTPNANYEGLVYYYGLLDGIVGDDETATGKVISDLSDKTAVLGTEISQRCLNELGDSWCGVGSLPGGATCSKVKADAENGCDYWGGVFNGISYIVPSVGQSAGGGDPTGSGWEPIRCVGLDSVFRGSEHPIPGLALKAGDTLLDHLDRAVIVEAVERVWQPYRYLVTCGNGASLIISASHKFIRTMDDVSGGRASAWNLSEWGLVTRTPGGIDVLAPASGIDGREHSFRFHVIAPGECLAITTSEPHTYLAGQCAGYYIANHNWKWEPMYGAVV